MGEDDGKPTNTGEQSENETKSISNERYGVSASDHQGRYGGDTSADRWGRERAHASNTHGTMEKQFGVYKALMWGDRWAGAEGQTYTNDCEWECMNKQVKLHEITPSWIGKQKAL